MKFVIISICDNGIMLISYVYNLFFKSRMELTSLIFDPHEEDIHFGL